MATASVCKIEGCDKPAKKRGLCNPHYNVWYRENVKAADTRRCGAKGCNEPLHAHGYCGRHAYKFRAHGDPLGGRRGSSPGEPLRWVTEHVDHQGDDCLMWPFEIANNGYGVVRHDGKKRVASRVMCEAAHGLPPANDYDAAHSCGNGHQGCMNPRHLSWKTRKDNVADAIDHGTWNHGEKVPSAKLTEADVREIRRIGTTQTQAALAERFGVRDNTISRILARKRWGWLD